MAQLTSEIITLLVEGQIFKVNRSLLCEKSDYFRAMFSGNFKEQEKEEICIDVVDANSMTIIIRYMTIGEIDITEFSLDTVADLGVSATYLQITELIKEIETSLESQLTMSNWLEIKAAAETATLPNLAERAAAFGLYDFKKMKPEYIKSVHKLVWCLSHSHLHMDSEVDAFKFGLDWMVQNGNNPDTMLLVLACLDMSRIKVQDLDKIKILIEAYTDSLLEKVVALLHKLITSFGVSHLSIFKMIENRHILCELYTERAYREAFQIISDCPQRRLEFKPCVAVYNRDHESTKPDTYLPNYLYRLENRKDLNPWLEATEKYIWGWKCVPWGIRKIVIVCGEHRKGTGHFWRGVKIYDTVAKEWTEHEVLLPCRRHGAAAINGDLLYLIGGVGAYRVVLDSVSVYDLKQKTHRTLGKFPDAIQSPAVCVHEEHVYATSHKHIFRFVDLGENLEGLDEWKLIIETKFRLNGLASYRGYIYCIQGYYNDLYRFRPDVDKELQLVVSFRFNPSTVCISGDKLNFFESADPTSVADLALEEYGEGDAKPEIIWFQQMSPVTFNDVAGACSIVDVLPPNTIELSNYLRNRVANFEAFFLSLSNEAALYTVGRDN